MAWLWFAICKVRDGARFIVQMFGLFALLLAFFLLVLLFDGRMNGGY